MSNPSGVPSSQEEANKKYEELRAQLKEGLDRKRQTDHDLTDLESQIYLYESSYFNSTALSGGNVIRGFDSYIKSGTAPASSSRTSSLAPPAEDRMFSTSSATYQRSLALKMNGPAGSDPKADKLKASITSGQASGYKLKRKGDDTGKKG